MHRVPMVNLFVIAAVVLHPLKPIHLGNLAMVKSNVTAQHINELNNTIQTYINKNNERKLRPQLPKSDTIIIDDANENENEREKSSSPSLWTCIKCTFKNQHLGNLCAMCDAAKPGSIINKVK